MCDVTNPREESLGVLLGFMDDVLIFDYTQGVVVTAHAGQQPAPQWLAEQELIPTSAVGAPPPPNSE